ncbi:unnamed protein product [Parnassius mnemosyne]|uniref:RNA-directed DNA polymerase n=1 Tax=Parnassius mnemosyne TaxID=213953 RepID=A0AAV1LZ37_9NEOP
MEHARPPTELSLDGSPVGRADAWKWWKVQFNLFLKASGVHKEEGSIQASLLINLIGSDGFDVYETFTFDSEEQREDIEILMKKFDEYFGVQSNITLLRYNFFTRYQETGESIDQYVTALKLLSKNCEFKNLEQELIRDRIVCGIRSTIVRDRLLRTDELTLEKAIKICQADEMSTDSKRVMETGSFGSSASCGPVRVEALAMRGGERRGGGRSGGRGGRRGTRAAHGGTATSPCPRCGAQCTDVDSCPAISVKCYVCGNYGHYARMCKCKNSVKKMYEIEVNTEKSNNDDCESFYVSVLMDKTQNKIGGDDWYEVLRGECGFERFKLDTGADINVLCYKRFLTLGFDTEMICNNNKMKLQSFRGDVIPIRGVCHLKWWHKSKMYVLKFAIANINCESVLGRQACSELGLIQRVYGINLVENSDLFEGLGCLPGEYHIVIDKSVKPVVCDPRKVPLGLRDKLLEELNRMTDLGVIRKVTHPTQWVNSIVIAAKKNGTLRICLDPRALNNAIQRAHFQLPTIKELATKIHGASFFSVLDANSGFWAIKLDDQSSDLCTFSTPFGRYQYLRLPYGLNCASEVFHAKIKQLIEDLDGVDSFIDDIICWGRNKDEHDRRLNALLNRAREINLKFNKDKCRICVEEVTYLGHIFNKNGMKPDLEKVKAIKNMPTPKERKSLERFLGAVNYLSKFIPKYSERIFPLTRLLKKDTEWCWESEQQNAFDLLKYLISKSPVLALYDVSQPAVVSVDASSVALGAVLLQGGRPIEYTSCTLTDTQTRYAQIEKEMLAILFACEKFHQYIYGKSDVLIETDHKPLESIFKKPLDSIPARLQRMILRLQCYDLIVTYKPGKYMYLADTLSRAPIPELYNDKVSDNVLCQVHMIVSNMPVSHKKLSVIKNETLKDNNLKLLMRYINQGWPEYKRDIEDNLKYYWSMRGDLFCVDGVIFKNKQILIPSSLRTEMLKIIHDGHLGIDRCKRRAREVLFWPGISYDIERYVNRCVVCRENSNNSSKEPMIAVSIPNLPWSKIGTDIFQYGKKSYLIIVDYYSCFTEVALLHETNSKSVINVLRENFARYGIPDIAISDNGPQFSSREFKNFAVEWGFEHITSSPNYAQSNGKSERAVQTIKKILKKSIDSGSDFYLNLLSYRNTPRDNLNSPAQLLMGRRLKCRLPVHPDLLKIGHVNNESQHKVMLDKQNKYKMYYDLRAKPLPVLDVGDKVTMIEKNNSKIPGHIIAKAATPRSYFIETKRGMVYRPNRRHLIKDKTQENRKSAQIVHENKEHNSMTTKTTFTSSENEEYSSNDEYEPTMLNIEVNENYSPPLTRSKVNKNKK